MTTFELANTERIYFGLTLVQETWNRVELSDSIAVYFDGDKIVKLLNYSRGYFEYDTDINTIDRVILLPKTTRGKQQKLTIPRILKIKGSGVQFSGTFLGGGIHVYDNNRNLFFIRSFPEEGEITNYTQISNWVSNYIKNQHHSYFDWLDEQLSQKRMKVKIREGDVFAFKIGHGEYGFGRVLLDVFTQKKKGEFDRPELYMIHPRSIIVAPYGFYADSVHIDITSLIQKKTLPSIYMFDLDLYRGEMPIIGSIPLNDLERAIPFPLKKATAFTMKYTKTDILAFISDNSL